jgi:putative chitinase
MCGGEDAQLADLAYGGSHSLAKSLGNTEDGDGWSYRGGGFFQGTGRAWFREAGHAIGHDLEGSPDLIENPAISLQAALWVWNKKSLNKYADANNLRAVGNAINRGNALSKHEPIGADGRRAAYDRAWATWGTGAIPTTTDIDVGSTGTEVLAIQLRLKELRYAPGSADSVFGRETGRAIAAFKADWLQDHGTELEPGTIVGTRTRAALADATPIERPEREQTTVAELAASGSTEIKAGQEMKALGAGTVAVGVAGVAKETGALDVVQNSVGWLPAAQSTLAPAMDALKWCLSNGIFIAILLVGLLVFYRGHVVMQARLLAHRLGFNLGR